MKHLIKKFTVSVVSFGLLFFALPTSSASATFYPTNLTRQDAYNAISYFRNNLLFAPYSWNGSVSGCNPGTVSSTISQEVLDTVNYFRSFNRLPAVTLDAADSSKAQQAALMMLANNQLSHVPPSTWTCYISVGAAAAGTSNLALGTNGPYAVFLYMQDSGPNLSTLGHRRWVLSGALSAIGSGDTSSSNALYLDKGTRPAGIPKFSGWPAQNYFPVQLAPDRWSLSNSDGTVDMSSARVSITMHGVTSAKTTLYMPVGYGDDAIAWDMPYLYTNPFPDLPVTITVSNLKDHSGSPLANYTYTTTLFDMYSATSPSSGGTGATGKGGTAAGGSTGGSSAKGSKASGGGAGTGSSSGQTSTSRSRAPAPLTLLKVNGAPLDTKKTVTQPADQPSPYPGRPYRTAW